MKFFFSGSPSQLFTATQSCGCPKFTAARKTKDTDLNCRLEEEGHGAEKKRRLRFDAHKQF